MNFIIQGGGELKALAGEAVHLCQLLDSSRLMLGGSAASVGGEPTRKSEPNSSLTACLEY